MYKNKARKRKSPQNTQFWQYASNLKKAGHKTIVHALAWEYPKAYSFLLSQFKQNTPLERITILLWRDYSDQMRKLEQKGFGTFSPTALKRFRDKYFLKSTMPDPEGIRKSKTVEVVTLKQEIDQLKVFLVKINKVEKKVHLTQTGENLRSQTFEKLSKLIKLQSQLS